MSKDAKTIEIKVERTIPAARHRVFDAWLDPKAPGTPWSMAEKLLLNAQVDGLFYWLVRGTPHYGRFTELERGARIQHTWMSPYTHGLESTVTVTFQDKAGATVMTLVHSGLPDDSDGRSHEGAWGGILDGFAQKL